MITLSNLRNTDRAKKIGRRVGRGVGCKRGKTCGRGAKGDKSRSGYKRRYGKEGGQLPLYRKLPTRGFSNAPFKMRIYALNLSRIDAEFEDGEVVSVITLREKKMAPRRIDGIKILGSGELTKKVSIEATHFSETAQEKLKQANIPFQTVVVLGIS